MGDIASGAHTDRLKAGRSYSAQDETRQKPEDRIFTFAELQEIWNSQGEQERRKETQNLLDIYSNEWLEQLAGEVKTQYLPQNQDKILQKADTTLNLARWVSQELGGIYDVPASRAVVIDGEETSEGLEPYLNGGTLDDCLAEAAPLAFLMRELFLRPVIQPDGSVVLDILTPERVAFVQNEIDPTKMDAMVIDLGEVDTGDTVEQRYELWTADSHAIVGADWQPIPDKDEEGGEQDTSNLYGLIPWVKFNAAYPARGKWHLSESFALRDATLITGVQKTDHNNLRHLQSHKQVVGISDGGGGDTEIKAKLKLLFDPMSAVHWRGGELKTLDMQANLAQHLDTMLSAVAIALNMHGIRPEAVRGSIDASSGYALSIKMHKQRQVWAKYGRSWTRTEKEIYRVTLIVRAYHLKADEIQADALPEGVLQISHGSLGPESNPLEQAQLAKELQEAGWSQQGTWREVWGWDEDRILQNIAERQAEATLFTPTALLQPPVDDDPEPEVT